MKMNSFRGPAFMAFSLMAAVLIGQYGCASSEMQTTEELEDTIIDQSELMRDSVNRFIKDPSTRDELLVLIGEMEKVFQGHTLVFADFMDTFRTLYRDHDTPREAMDDVLHAYKARRQETRERILELHMKMTALTTAKEWRKIVEYELKALDASYKTSNVGTKG